MCFRSWEKSLRWGWFLSLAAAVVAVGCAPPKGSVTGKVTFKDSPLKGGNVTFHSTDGKPLQGSPIGEDGTYTIDNLPLGALTITVETDSLAKAARTPKNAPPPGATPPPGYTGVDSAEAAKHYVKIPDKYKDPATSGLTYTVAAGSQKHDIELK